MERLSILKYNKQSDFTLYYTEKPPELLCEVCGTILTSKQALNRHIVTKHSEKVTTYQCSKCEMTCNRFDNMRCHIRKHPGPTTTPKIISYEIKQMSPEPSRPRRHRFNTRPYLNEPKTPVDYIYQQTLRSEQRPIPWQLIPIDIPESTKKNIPNNPKDPRLSQDHQEAQDHEDQDHEDQELEDMNRQLLAELEVSSSSSGSSINSPIQDLDLQDHPEDWLVLDEL